MFLTKYGTVIGDINASYGRVFFVSPTAAYTVNGNSAEASDDNDGLSPERAVRTITRAIALATASVGDIIALFPGSYTSAAVVNINKAGLTFLGLNQNFRDREAQKPHALATKVTWTSTLAGTAVALTVADTTFIGINFVPVTARTFMTMVTCPRTVVMDCAITLSAAASTSTKGLVASGGASENCHFSNLAILNSIATSAQGPALDLTALNSFILEDSTILLSGTSSAWAVAVQMGSGSNGIVRRNHISALGVGTITIGFDGTGVTIANSVSFKDNTAGVSPGAGAYKNFDADSATTVTCYTAAVNGAGVVEVSNHVVI